MINWTLLATAAAALLFWLDKRRRQAQQWKLAGQRSRQTVSVIIPALNEAKALRQTLEWLQRLTPAVHEVIVVDGDSTDGTIGVAEAAGARVVRAGRGRAIQMNAGAATATGRGHAIEMNAGAAAATGDLLCFLHADSRPPGALVYLMRATLADPRCVLGGFRTLICGGDGKLLRFMTAHHLVKTYYLVMLARPLMWLGGGICLFGDQTLFCRATDFSAAGGYDESLPIMEDVQLCITMHELGPAANSAAAKSAVGSGGSAAAKPAAKASASSGRSAAAATAAAAGGCSSTGGRGRAALESGSRSGKRMRGRVKMIWWPPAETSGRRLEALGNWNATRIHFTIGLGWYLGISRQRLFNMYRTMYSDSYR